VSGGRGGEQLFVRRDASGIDRDALRRGARTGSW
jgi:hypothetical protein